MWNKEGTGVFRGFVFLAVYSSPGHSALVDSVDTFSDVYHPSSALPLVPGHWTSNGCLVCQDSSAKSRAPFRYHTEQHGGKSMCSSVCSRDAPFPLEIPVWQLVSLFRCSFSGGDNLWLPQKYLMLQFSNECLGYSLNRLWLSLAWVDGISCYSTFFSFKSFPHVRNTGLLAATTK